MKALSILMLLTLVVLGSLAPGQAQAQPYTATQSDAPGQTQSVDKRPRLKAPEVATPKDEVVRVEGQSIIYRSGENLPMPITAGAPLRLSLEPGISTSKMSDGVRVTRLLAIRTQLETPYQGTYGKPDQLVLTEFLGRKSGFKDRSFLMISPKQFQVEVGPAEYLVIGMVDGVYVVLKPGKWRFELQCSLRQIVTPTGETWTVPANSETDGIKGGKFGREQKEESYEDYSGLAYFPRGEIAFGIVQLKGLWRYLIHRPNVVLPNGTDLFFRVDRITATYIGPLVPTGPAAIVNGPRVVNKQNQ